MGAFGVVELQRAGDGFEDGRGDAGKAAAFQLGVVLDADIGHGGDRYTVRQGLAVLPIDRFPGKRGTSAARSSAPFGGRPRCEGAAAVRVVVMHALGDFRVQEREELKILKPTDAIIRVSATCECGSDLWPYRGAEPIDVPSPIGHEYMGFVEEADSEVTTVTPGRFVVGAFSTSDNTCVNCRAGYQTSCVQREWVNARGAQAERLRIPLADDILVATPGMPDDDLIPSLLTASDAWAPDGSRPRPPGPDRARRSPLSVTERSACWVCPWETPTWPTCPPGRAERMAWSIDSCVPTATSSPNAATTVLLPRPPARRARPGTPVPARVDRPGLGAGDQPGQGLRSHPAAGSVRRRLSGDGRAPRDHGLAQPLT